MPTANEQARRNTEIFAAKARGLSVPTIANTYAVSPRRVREIVKEQRETMQPLRNDDPLDIVDEILEGLQADIEEIALISATATSPAVRVSAVSKRADLRMEIAVVLQAVGVLPRDLGQFAVEIDARAVGKAIVSVLNEAGVSVEVQEELLSALRDGRVQPAGSG